MKPLGKGSPQAAVYQSNDEMGDRQQCLGVSAKNKAGTLQSYGLQGVNECKSGLVHCHSVGPWPHCIILLCFRNLWVSTQTDPGALFLPPSLSSLVGMLETCLNTSIMIIHIIIGSVF